MKKTMILGLCIALIASIIMIGGEVKAEDVSKSPVAPQTKVIPQANVSVDKPTVKKGDTVKLTVTFPKPKDDEMLNLYSIKFDDAKFSYIQDSIELIGFRGNTSDVNYFDFTSSSKTTPYGKSDKVIADNEMLALIALNYLGDAESKTNISGFSVEFEVKEDLTKATPFVVSKLNMEGDFAEQYTLDISVNPVESEPEPEPQQPGDNPADQPDNPQENPTDEPTNQPDNSQNNSTNKPADESSEELDDTPQTGVVDYVGIAVAISMLSMLGVGILRRKK